MTADSLMKLVPACEYRHARLFAGVRAAVGVWLLILTAILFGSHRSDWWALLLVPAAAVLFLAAFAMPRAVRARGGSKDAK
jgi:membrane-bound ClpP family serine protease